MRIYSLVNFLESDGIFRYVLILFMFQSISFLMPNLYLSLSFELGYELRYEAMSLVSVFILMLKPMPVIDIPFSGIILKKSSNNFKEVCFILSVSFDIDYQVF